MDNANGQPLEESPALEFIGKFIVVGIVVLFLGVVSIFFLHLYAKWYCWRVEETTQNPRRRRFVFSAGEDPATAAVPKGLDPSALRSLPVLVFNPEDFKEGLECAVCLSEVEQGEKARLLPKCNHGFHVECINMWFQSHSTCPLCRNLVVSDTEDLHPVEENSESLNQGEVSSVGASVEPNSPSSPTSTSSSPDGMLIIDIPVHLTENLSSLSPSGTMLAEEELKSPMAARLRSLKRLLSKEKKVCPCSSSCAEAEQVDRNEPEFMIC